jgi:hypothetical protein
MATTAPGRRRELISQSQVLGGPPEVGDDGFPIRHWKVGDEVVAFSLKPYPEQERPLYWNPIYAGQQMWWREQDVSEFGFQRVIQKEVWHDGKFYPRNAWEEHMTREFLKTLPSGGDPDSWKGVNHPDGPDHQWRCECSWPCGNWRAFQAHRRFLGHREAMTE